MKHQEEGRKKSAKVLQETGNIRQRKNMVPKLADLGQLNELNSLSEEGLSRSSTSSPHDDYRKQKVKQTNHNCKDINKEKLDEINIKETEFSIGNNDNSEEDFLLADDPLSSEIIDPSIGDDENSLMIALQVFFPFFAAGLGTVAAGLLLDKVQHWKVYNNLPEIYILVPALLGLKGNLEMTLASRLSTAANVGHMETTEQKRSIIGGNLALTQAQALVVAALASVAAVLFRWVASGKFDINHTFLMCASSLITASVASALLGGIMCAVIVLSKKYRINPDNVATPIAASLGDLVTLAFLSVFSNFLYLRIYAAPNTQHWLAPLVCALFLLLLPLWMYIAHHNQYTHNTLYTGWSPVIVAMCISSAGGLILSYFVRSFEGIAVFSPVVNGVGGNLVAVQASRLATALHKQVELGTLPNSTNYGCIKTFCTGGGHSRTARVLLLMSIPGHIIFLAIISNLKAGHTSTTMRFILMYLTTGFIQVATLLFICNWLVHFLWKLKKDPDNYSIPYLTALGDLLGTALLAVSFYLLNVMGDGDEDLGE